MPLTRTEYAQRLAKIVALLAQEPPDDEGWSTTRISEMTGISKASVSAHIRRHRLSPLQRLKRTKDTDADPGWRAGRAPEWRYIEDRQKRKARKVSP